MAKVIKDNVDFYTTLDGQFLKEKIIILNIPVEIPVKATTTLNTGLY